MPTTLPAPPVRRPVVPNSVLGTLVFVVPETLFFVGMISAFTISKAGAPAGSWPVPGQPLLPAAATAVNTAALVLSGLLLLGAHFLHARKSPVAKWLVTASFALGLLFVGLQGKEWADLLSQGLTLTSSRLGSFFYFIVGTHALHAVAALVALGMVTDQFLLMGKPQSSSSLLGAVLGALMALAALGPWFVLTASAEVAGQSFSASSGGMSGVHATEGLILVFAGITYAVMAIMGVAFRWVPAAVAVVSLAAFGVRLKGTLPSFSFNAAGASASSGTHLAWGWVIALACAVLALAASWLRPSKPSAEFDPSLFYGTQVFWYFVVLMWPVIYVRVYF